MIAEAHILKKKKFAKQNSSTPSPPPPGKEWSPRFFFSFSSILQNGYPQGVIRHHINDVLKQFFILNAHAPMSEKCSE